MNNFFLGPIILVLLLVGCGDTTNQQSPAEPVTSPEPEITAAQPRTEPPEQPDSKWDKARQESAEAWNATKEAGSSTWEAARDTSADAWDATKEKSSEAWEATTEKSGELWNKTRSVSSDAWEATRETSKEVWEATSSGARKATNAIDEKLSGDSTRSE
jgi:hypothetical protein